MKSITILIIIIVSFFLISFQFCSSSINKKDNKDSAFSKGKIIPKVICKNDKTQNYALYLPSYYSVEKKWPIVYAFDSHACGFIPVELFKDEAEKFGYIIIGSNNSKNGTKWNITSALYDTIYNDTHNRFTIDDNRIYTAGFSGGSRVASTLAITKNNINSVIACGAGIGTQIQPNNKFGFFGIAGNEDMNLLEMIVLDSFLQNSKFNNFLEIFDGKHEWPPKQVFSDVFIWLEFNAMKDKLIPVNDTLVKNTFDRWSNSYTKISNSCRYYESYILCKKIINYFNGLYDISIFLFKSNLISIS